MLARLFWRFYFQLAGIEPVRGALVMLFGKVRVAVGHARGLLSHVFSDFEEGFPVLHEPACERVPEGVKDAFPASVGRETLESAVKSFRPGNYRPPQTPMQTGRTQDRTLSPEGLPASCPFDREFLEQAAREHPNIVPCPVTKPAWGWVEKRWCDSKCKGHPDCIRNLYWAAPALP